MSNSCNVKKSKSCQASITALLVSVLSCKHGEEKARLELSRFNGYLINVGKCGVIPLRGNGEGEDGGGGLFVNSKLGWRRHTVVRSVNSVMRLLPPTSMPVKIL